ncbi:crossover junction endonuclease MUS81 isoform X1 [Lolium perenne]|uniref:crossover junction endonuclease MUS81 isoform X1 n=1 Tax=Lolium perenne TaxID=4522 RepID=UPI0021F67FC0|nr:crossover junction endonuclease MUS81-like [Lolium perenne]
MAPPSAPKKRKVHLPENEDVAGKILEKHRSMAEQPGGLSGQQALDLSAAYRGVCAAKQPIRTSRDLLRTKGVENWVFNFMKDSFPSSSPDLSPQEVNERKYVPRKNSAPYAIVITLYREMVRGKNYMMKQELIDAAEASGLSESAIGPNNTRAKPGNSQNDWYTGWSCINKLISKKLVEKWSSPAKYMLTEEGEKTARDCLERSGLDDTVGPSTHHSEVVLSDSDSDEPYEDSENFAERSGPPKLKAGSSSSFDISKGPIDAPLSSRGMFGQQSFSAMGSAENFLLAMPPRHSIENFLEAYEVVLILDDRETLGRRARRNVVDNIRSQFGIPVKMKRLPVGDAIWIAHHKVLHTEYVLDFIVERKSVDDLVGSIRDNRYKDQKLRLKKCGLKNLIYLVEGDPNTVDASESVKTACFTTEILEGFDVQRTTGYSDTEKKYGQLTRSIIDYYSTNFSAGADSSRLCLTYDEFVKRCSDLEKVTMSDVFALQLMQVPQATEEAVLAVTSLYPTLLSLAQAYAMLDGDRRAQEEMLMNKCNLVKAGASKAIFKFVWAEG